MVVPLLLVVTLPQGIVSIVASIMGRVSGWRRWWVTGWRERRRGRVTRRWRWR